MVEDVVNGGIMVVAAPAAVQQIVYLDFDGELTSYNGEILTIDDVVVEESGLNTTQISAIADQLNEDFADRGVIFVTERPAEGDFSTIYIGKTSAFEKYGNFAGLAETIDKGNLIKDDNAFVFADTTSDLDAVISVIGHEVGHIVEGEEHFELTGGIEDYAVNYFLGTVSSINKYESIELIDLQNGYWFEVPSSGYYEINFSSDTAFVSGRIQSEVGSTLNWCTWDTSVSPSNPFLQFGVQNDEIVQFGNKKKVVLYLEENHQYHIYARCSSDASFSTKYWYSLTMKQYQGSAASDSTQTQYLPDLLIAQSALSRTSEDTVRFDPSEGFTYEFTVKNAGDLSAKNIKAYIYVDGKRHTQIQLGTIASNASESYKYRFAAGSLKNGEHNIHVVVDEDNTINEYDENNNASNVSKVIIEPAMADLAVSSFSISNIDENKFPVSDKDIVVTAVIKNLSGNKKSDASRAALYVDGELRQLFDIAPVDVGGTTTVSGVLAAGLISSGTRNFKLVVDCDDNVKESNENNNSITVSEKIYEPIKPDLQVADFTCNNGEAIYADKPIDIKIEVENYVNGDLSHGHSSSDTELTLLCNWIKLKEFHISPLEPGKKQVLTCTLPAGLLPDGENVFSVVIDERNRCEEYNEENNLWTITKTSSIFSGCDLTVQSLRIENPNNSSYISEGSYIVFTVKNNGNFSSAPTIGVINNQNSRLYEFYIDSLDPGKSRQYRIKTSHNDAYCQGSFDVIVDLNGISKDKDNSNNTATSENFNITKPLVGHGKRVLISSYAYAEQQILQSVTLGKDEFYVGFDPRLEYSGDKTVVIELYSGDDLIATKSILNKYDNYTGKWLYAKFSTDLLSNGQHTLRVHAYEKDHPHVSDPYLDTVNWWTFDANVTNGNSLSDLEPWEGLKPNLVITSATVNCIEDLNNAQQITFSVKNDGNYAAFKQSQSLNSVAVYDGDKKIATYNLPNIEKGETKTFTFTLDGTSVLSVGMHNLTLKVQTCYSGSNENTYDLSVDILQKESQSPITIKQNLNSDGSTTISAVFDDSNGISARQYSIDLSDWKNYTAPFVVNKSCLIHFRLTDSKGDSVVETVEFVPESEVKYLYADKTGVSWGKKEDVESYEVQYSSDNFQHTFYLKTGNNEIDFLGVPGGNYKWRVKIQNTDTWNIGNNFNVSGDDKASQYFRSDEDGNLDLFFATYKNQWGEKYKAQHQGIFNGWDGLGEKVAIAGKNRLTGVFEGSTDANILVLTDDANGDALFIDDIFSALPKGVVLQQARFSQIDEIRAGAGNDVIDMTSQQFTYTGDEMTIYGGDGNDVIWANLGENHLFGDAGNDRIVGASGNDVIVGGIGNDTMHGGGGDDIFTFGGDWGNDIVEQLDGGSVTLWFEDGSEDNWNADTRTYTDGENSVTVSGTADVTLKFGGDVSSLPDGVFADSVMEKIFENTDSAMLA